jgi:16S rRNA (guanine1516-N2)-methyltransferase
MVLDWVALLHGVTAGTDDGGNQVGAEARSRQAGRQQPRTQPRLGKDLLVRAVLAGRQGKATRKSEEPVTAALRVDDCAGPQPGSGSSVETDGDAQCYGFEVSADVGPVIVDLTAGWGTDALALLRAGAGQVVLVERNRVVAALLRDAHRRLRNFEARARLSRAGNGRNKSYASRIRVVEGDGIEVASGRQRELFLSSNETAVGDRPNAVYLDPMFPARTKSAAVKKPMQILHSLMLRQPSTSTASDSKLLEAALRLAKHRVVVKRPVRADPLGMKTPSFTHKGSTHRWDVYMAAHPS